MRKVLFIFLVFSLIFSSASCAAKECGEISLDACLFFYKTCMRIRGYGYSEETAVNLLKIKCELEMKQHPEYGTMVGELVSNIAERCCKAAYNPPALKKAIKDSVIECYDKTFEEALKNLNPGQKNGN